MVWHRIKECLRSFSWDDARGSYAAVLGWGKCLKSVSLLGWCNLIVAFAAIWGLFQMSASLKETAKVNAKTIAYYESQMVPRFEIRHECPPAETNDYCHKCVVRNTRISNDGFPVAAITSASTYTVLEVFVIDKRSLVKTGTRKDFPSQPIECPIYYTDDLYPFNPQGLIYSGEPHSFQYEIATAYRDYLKKHPDRECRILVRDYVKIEYVDNQGANRTKWLCEGSQTNGEAYKSLRNRSRKFLQSLNPSGANYWEQVFDACFQANKKLASES